MLGDNFVNILAHDIVDGYAHGFITKDFLVTQISSTDKNVYLCGPPPMMDTIEKLLEEINVDEKLIIKEAF